MIHLQRNIIAVEPIRPPETTATGRIIIPEQAQDRIKQGIVKYVGPECKYVKVGDYVIFGAYTGTLLKIGDELLIMFQEEFVEAKLVELPVTEIPGLYFRGEDGKYFQATYEMAMTILAEGIQNANWYREFQKSVKDAGSKD